MKNIDAFELTANLIKCPSVTPDEGGAITLLDDLLSQNGFECTRIERGGVSNLFARWGSGNNGRTFGLTVTRMLFPLAISLHGVLIHLVPRLRMDSCMGVVLRI